MEITAFMVRNAMQALGDKGHEVSYRHVYEALGLENDAQQAIVRSRITDMLRYGEVKRISPGLFSYIGKHKTRGSKTFSSIWRFVRAAKPGWTITHAAMMTRVSYTQVLRYCAWLEGEGFIERMGRDEKRSNTYRGTSKAMASPETPYPPIKDIDPFQKERTAAATITRLMLCADPYAVKTATTIVEACHVLLARFDKQQEAIC